MKKNLLIAASLVANVALITLLAKSSADRVRADADASMAAPAGAREARDSSADEPADFVDPKTWSVLTSGDLPAIAARLRAGGYPLSLQRAILSALIAEQFADRHKAIADMINAQPWWRGNIFGSPAGAKVITARQALQREQKELLDHLLGPDAGATDYARARQARQVGDLPPAKASELGRIIADYDELMREVRNAAGNILLPEDRAQLALLEKEKRADIAKLLTPEELFEYDLRSSPTANQLRNTLVAFAPDDDEYRAIFKVQLPFDAKYGPPELMSPEQLRQRRAEQPKVVEAMKAVLTPERFAEYQQKTDNAYLQAHALVKRLQLPETAAAEIVAVQKEILKRAESVRANAALPPEQRAAELAALGAEANLRLTPTLGERGLAAYKQGGGGWINSLQRPPAPPPPPAPPKT